MVNTVNGEQLTVSPAGGGALLFRGRQSAATSVRTDLKTCNSVVDFINQARPLGQLAASCAALCSLTNISKLLALVIGVAAAFDAECGEC